MKVTLRQARQLEKRLGMKLGWVDITIYGDPEPMVLMTTPRCDYCGMPDPTGHCQSCGASVLVDGPLQRGRVSFPARQPDRIRR